MIMMSGAVCGKSTGNGVWEFHPYIHTYLVPGGSCIERCFGMNCRPACQRRDLFLAKEWNGYKTRAVMMEPQMMPKGCSIPVGQVLDHILSSIQRPSNTAICERRTHPSSASF